MRYPGGLDDDDYNVLTFIAERDMVVQPKTISANTGIPHSEVKHIVRGLMEKGFLKRPESLPNGMNPRGLYAVTELGRAYAEGDATIAELRELVEKQGLDNS